MDSNHKGILRCIRVDDFTELCIEAIADALHCSKSEAIRRAIVVVRVLFDENLTIGDVLTTTNPTENFAKNIQNLNILAKKAKIYVPYKLTDTPNGINQDKEVEE